MDGQTNADYVIYIETRRGRKWRYLRRANDGWTQTAPTGAVRRLSAEQLLSHLLPPLAADQPGLRVRVKRRQLQRRAARGGGLTPGDEGNSRKTV